MASPPIHTPMLPQPQVLQQFCSGISNEVLSNKQMGFLLAMAHCTGWSADRINGYFHAESSIWVGGQVIHNTHKAWVEARGTDVLADEDLGVAHTLLAIGGLHFKPSHRGRVERPLSGTQPLPDVVFKRHWNLDSNDELFPGFNQDSRHLTKAYLRDHHDWSLSILIRILTPSEIAIISPFGHNFLWLVSTTLAHWGTAMDERYDRSDNAGFLTMYTQKEDVACIVDHISYYESEFEVMFGKMEKPIPSKDEILNITSTGHCIKVLLGLLMADRMTVVRERCLEARARAGFLKMDASKLPVDTNCPICKEQFKNETPIKLISCCGQICGVGCLKVWISQKLHGNTFQQTCPMCRFRFPLTFVRKLFTPEQYRQRLSGKTINLDMDAVGEFPEDLSENEYNARFWSQIDDIEEIVNAEGEEDAFEPEEEDFEEEIEEEYEHEEDQTDANLEPDNNSADEEAEVECNVDSDEDAEFELDDDFFMEG